MMPAWWNAWRNRAMRFGSRNQCNAASRSSGERVTAGAASRGPGQLGLRLLHRQQQPAHVALKQVRGQAGFLGGAFHEAAALASRQSQPGPDGSARRHASATRLSARRCRWFFPGRPRDIRGLPIREPSVVALFKRGCALTNGRSLVRRWRRWPFLFSRCRRQPLTEAAKEEESGRGCLSTGAGGVGRRWWPCASASHAAEFNKQRQRFVGGFDLAGVFVGVHAVRELHPENFDAVRLNRSASRCAARSPASSAS